jgi:RNA polymerase sigma factor FliA
MEPNIQTLDEVMVLQETQRERLDIEDQVFFDRLDGALLGDFDQRLSTFLDLANKIESPLFIYTEPDSYWELPDEGVDSVNEDQIDIEYEDETVYDTLESYLREIRPYPLLTREGEIYFFKKLWLGKLAESLSQDQDLDKTLDNEKRVLIESAITEAELARDTIFCCNTRWVVDIVFRSKFKVLSVPLIDRIQAGNEGMSDALERHDPRIGRFTTYSSNAIINAVLDLISRELYGCGRETWRSKIKTIAEYLGRNEFLVNGSFTNCRVDIAEIARETNIHPDSVRWALKAMRRQLELNASDNEGRDLSERIPDIRVNVAAEASRNYTLDSIWQTADSLFSQKRINERDMEIFNLYYRKGMSTNEIAKIYGISRQRVSQLLSNTVRKIRKVMKIDTKEVEETFEM